MIGSRSRRGLLAASVLSLTPTWCFGAILNVDNQNASCNNTSGAPFCSISAAIAKATAGDVIQVAAGTYAEHVSLDKNLTLTGHGAGDTIVDGGNTDRALVIWSDAVISGFTFRHGNASTSGLGGAVAQLNAHTVQISDCILRDSTAADGAGLLVDGNVTVTRTLITGNASVSDALSSSGGIYVSGTASLTVTNSTISGNSADYAGGIFNLGTLTVTNSTISGNVAGSSGDGAGALQNGSGSEGTATLRNVTITGNSSGAAYGGIYNMRGSIDIANSIVAGNTAVSRSPDCGGASLTSAGYNFIGKTSGCTMSAGTGDLLNRGAAAAKLSTLDDYGGPTPTHTLLSGSLAIDAGSNALCPATDQRGVARPVDGNGDGTGTCDIGAFELSDGFIVRAETLTTTEAGGAASFTVALMSAPAADVSVAVSSSDTTEGTVSPGTLTFTAGNWNTPQTVTVTGVDDDVADGNVRYAVNFTAAVSADGRYNGVVAAPVGVTNTDNEAASGGGGGGSLGVTSLSMLAVAALVSRRRRSV